MTEQTGPTRGGALVIRTSGDKSEVEISGVPMDIIFNWTALTNQVCDIVGITPSELAGLLPQMIDNYRRDVIKEEIKIGETKRRPENDLQ